MLYCRFWRASADIAPYFTFIWMICHKSYHNLIRGLQIVASDLDADKIDYLMRDMQMAGVHQQPELAEVLAELGGKLPNYAQLIDNSKVSSAIGFYHKRMV